MKEQTHDLILIAILGLALGFGFAYILIKYGFMYSVGAIGSWLIMILIGWVVLMAFLTVIVTLWSIWRNRNQIIGYFQAVKISCSQVARVLTPYMPFVPTRITVMAMILLKWLDVLTTWVFLNLGLSEGNAYMRAIIRLYGLDFAWHYSTLITFMLVYVMVRMWEKNEGSFKLSALISINVGVIMSLIVPLYNLTLTYLAWRGGFI